MFEFPETVNCGPWQNPEIDANRRLHGKPLVHYHFHEFRRGHGKNPVMINGRPWNMTNYHLPETTRRSVYEPYVAAIARHA